MQGPIREALPNVLTLQCDDSKSEQLPDESALMQDSSQISLMDPEDMEATSLSQHPAAVRSRHYRQRLRDGTAGTRKSQVSKRHESQKPLWTADQIRDKLRRWDRSPFMDLLGAWIECAPTPEALTAFSDRFPDRYATSLLALSKIAGFAERKELTADISGNIVHRIEDMSDSQLEDHLRELAYRVGIPMPKSLVLTIDATPVPAPINENPQGADAPQGSDLSNEE